VPDIDKSLATTRTVANTGGALQLPQNHSQQLDVASVQTRDGNTAG